MTYFCSPRIMRPLNILRSFLYSSWYMHWHSAHPNLSNNLSFFVLLHSYDRYVRALYHFVFYSFA